VVVISAGGSRLLAVAACGDRLPMVKASKAPTAVG
jgi:hypothetical protein